MGEQDNGMWERRNRTSEGKGKGDRERKKVKRECGESQIMECGRDGIGERVER